jgi:hypothetical protein
VLHLAKSSSGPGSLDNGGTASRRMPRSATRYPDIALSTASASSGESVTAARPRSTDFM